MAEKLMRSSTRSFIWNSMYCILFALFITPIHSKKVDVDKNIVFTDFIANFTGQCSDECLNLSSLQIVNLYDLSQYDERLKECMQTSSDDCLLRNQMRVFFFEDGFCSYGSQVSFFGWKFPGWNFSFLDDDFVIYGDVTAHDVRYSSLTCNSGTLRIIDTESHRFPCDTIPSANKISATFDFSFVNLADSNRLSITWNRPYELQNKSFDSDHLFTFIISDNASRTQNHCLVQGIKGITVRSHREVTKKSLGY